MIERHAESERAKAAEIEEATAEQRAQIKAIEDDIKERYETADTAAQEAIDAANARLEELAAQVRERWDSTEFDPNRRWTPTTAACCTTRGAAGSTSSRHSKPLKTGPAIPLPHRPPGHQADQPKEVRCAMSTRRKPNSGDPRR